MFCPHCGHNPCKAVFYKDVLADELTALSSSLDNSKKRNHLYCCYVATEHGSLGCCICICIPECIIAFICNLVPSLDNKYTGHCDVDDIGEEVEKKNELFKSVLPDAVAGGGINYDGGGKIKICVTFDSTTFSIVQVRYFILQSPVEGWQVTFIGDTYTNATIICSSGDIFHEAYVYCMMNHDKFTQVVYDKVN